ncbi:hypothetical protein GE061_001188 [Apolygus lucorum]|uniref:Aminotransferase class V domain-containing protein n=1 Tax=Apolygus lucorum TaxID=248454 RepID=A0A6A4K4J2_APOLU|nr:hypothetical protein GE061_001188 [Apolygus lucorum]
MSEATKEVTFERHATFYLEDDYSLNPKEDKKPSDKEKLVRFIDENVVGKQQTFAGPFGRRKVVYCDYTASARSLVFIENYILNEVLPLYGNTHSTVAATSMQSTSFREEARDILKHAVNASDDDVVLFAGSGCTGAVKKLIDALNLTAPPIVFVGPCEHDSNLLPWRELGSKIVRISETRDGVLDLTDLQKKLEIHRGIHKQEVMIGCFSAASNITGILTDDIATTILLHQYGALAIWDYATAAPYVALDMNPLVPGIDQHTPHKDAMFFSGHKFIGGVQSTGILVAKKSLFTEQSVQESIRKTTCCNSHGNFKDTEFKEEAGTVAIVESIRAGMAMKLKQSVGVPVIMDNEDKIVKIVLSFMRKIPEITLLGSTCLNVKRLAVFSIMVRHPRGSYLHHNFVCAILNDVFGIQARGGCACAGPYAQDLMGISKELASHFDEVLMEDKLDCDHQLQNEDPHSSNEMLRPGFTRLTFPFFMSESEVAYVLEAVKMVATEGWKLLPQYVLNPIYRERKRLSSIKFADGKMNINERKSSSVSPCPADFSDCLKTARSIFNRARKMAKRHPSSDQSAMFDKQLNRLRWFMLPSEAQDLLLGQSRNVKQDVPFSPTTYLGSRPHTVNLLDMKRHHSLIVESEYSPNRDWKMMRQRSESNSPARSVASKPLQHAPSRERCYSLGSALIPELPQKLSMSRQRLLSFGSQADYTDSETSTPSEHDSKGEPSLRYTPDLVYVEGVTKELATEIKSEIRDIIAQVDDVLFENVELDGFNTDKRMSIDWQRSSKRKAHSLPITSLQPTITPNNSLTTLVSSSSQSSFSSSTSQCNNNLPTTISAETFSKYLVGFASDVVSEMKSEFRDVVNVVDGIMSPQADCSKYHDESSIDSDITPQPSVIQTVDQGDINVVDSKLCSVKNQFSDLQCSQDSGINLTERDPSPPDSLELKNKKTIPKKFIHDKENIIGKPVVKKRTSKTKIPKQTAPQWLYPTKSVWKPTLEALKEFDMIQDGDRILVCLSGGKDSLTLLHTLHQYQYYCSPRGINFKLGAATIGVGNSELYGKTLIPYLNALGIEHHFEKQDGAVGSSSAPQKSVCGFCSHVKRGKLYNIARANGYNVLALGQHLDDVSESFFMSVFHNGYLRSMKAHYIVRDEDLRVIRPMIYVREQSLQQFSESRRLPSFSQNCEICANMPKERSRIKQVLADQELLFPKLFLSIKSALKPLISLRYTGLESSDARISWKNASSGVE